MTSDKPRNRMVSGRFLVTGTQLGMIVGLAKAGHPTKLEEFVDRIVAEQFVFSSIRSLQHDVKKVERLVS